MDNETLRNWIKDGIARGYEREFLINLLIKDGQSEGVIKEAEAIYLEETTPKDSEPMKLGFFDKWKLRKQFKALHKVMRLQREILDKVGGKLDNASKKEQKIIIDLKEQMIEAIVGDVEKKKAGLNTIFEVFNEDGSEITKESLRKEKIDDVADLLEDMITKLEKEI